MSETIRVEEVVDLARVYEPEVTSAVWSRALPDELSAWLDALRRGTALNVVSRYRPGVDRPDALAPALDAHHPAALLAARLITTYAGAGTEWVDDRFARRDLLGHAYRGDGDPNDAIVPDPARIQRLRAGDVGIFKGDAWPGREGRGCVHRSPPHVPGEPPRILLTLEALES